jgi:hypothetical protein
MSAAPAATAVSMRNLDLLVLDRIVKFAARVSTQHMPAVQTLCGPLVHVHAADAGDRLRRVSRAFRDLVRWLRRGDIMPSLCLARDALFEHTVFSAMHWIEHERAEDHGVGYNIMFTMHMNGNQLALHASCFATQDACHLRFALAFCVPEMRTPFRDEYGEAQGRAVSYMHETVPLAFKTPVALRTAAQVDELRAWTREHAPLLVQEVHLRMAVLRDEMVGRVPCLLSASALSGVNAALRVTYITGGALNTLTEVYDLFACLEDCVRKMFANHADINVYEHRFFGDTGEEETLTSANGKPVLLDHLSGEDEMVGPIDMQEEMHVIELIMIRRCMTLASAKDALRTARVAWYKAMHTRDTKWTPAVEDEEYGTIRILESTVRILQGFLPDYDPKANKACYAASP